ncbi:outer membrane protein assembly factor BamB family protein [Kibdelosporangium aridum]|uniref:Outer membrane protein assembly factor BamB, contains PQQ-like beta-propeller repeat n=1 Tax=Kibdelosporangium aridum TaxID=2030 RepID=A0A1W2FXY6_KIBAR|nr:PQQ-binding-like beta-propeller repeat protein [Kibdelosporangium aridum]SMD26506.1 Outer membrane protein assembly factor BamB, contains PQQ-like beta-propeller repeat [Kibdelosporangium aridum]
MTTRKLRAGALALVTGALLAGAASLGGADPAPASPATAPHLAPVWTSHFGSGKYQASPVVAGDFVYIGDENGYLTKFPLRTGTASTATPPTFQPTWSTNECFNSIFSKPAVGNAKVYVSTIAGYVCAFEDSTDPDPDLQWRQAMPSGGWANGPVLVGDTIYVSGHNGDILALNAETGAPRWRTNVGGANAQNPLLGSPIVLGGKVYVGTSDGRVMAVTPPTGGAPATVTELKKFNGGRISDTLATNGTHLYAAVNYVTSPSVGRVHAVSLTTAGVVRWDRDTGLDPTYSGRMQAPAVADGIVYVPTKVNVVYYDSETGARTALADAGDNQPTTPTVVNGVAYVGGLQASGRASGALQAFDAKTGVTLYYSHTPTVAYTSPAVAPNGIVLLGGGNSGQGAGVVWAYAPHSGTHNN